MKVFSSTKAGINNLNLNLNKFFTKISFSQDNFLLVLGAIVGLLAGVAAIVFHEGIHFIKEIFFDKPGEYFNLDSLLDGNSITISILIILVPAVGGLLVGLIAHFFEKGEGGEGIPNVIDAVASKGGIIKGSIALKKIIAAALSIGTGGAGGMEGPTVQIGSSIASSFGQFFYLSPERLRILVGCGAAAGLSAAFNAPLGGALFAMEIVLRTFNAKTFSPIIISSVFATALSRGFLSKAPTFAIPKYAMVSNYELIFYVILGLLAGLVAVYFIKVFYSIEDFWEKFPKIPKYIKPALGGLIVGVIGLFLPGVYGFSYEAINASLLSEPSIYVLGALLLFKPVATAMTIGSGGNGGTFAPSLFTGAMIGGLFGHFVNQYFPAISAHPGAYALVGMGAVVAGTTQASLTALIMVFEMSDNYRIILPLMLTIIIARTVSKAIVNGDLYSLNFMRRGKEIDIYGRKTSILKKMSVQQLIDKKVEPIYEGYNFIRILAAIKHSKHNTLLVKNNKDQLVGQISFRDIRDTLIDEDAKEISNFLIARDIMTSINGIVKSDSNCEEVLKLMESVDAEYLPVISKDSGEFLGIVSKADILKRYQNEVFVQNRQEELQ